MPAFSLPTDGGGQVSNADYAGKQLVVFFYPRDDTSGCTKEAIGFSALLDEFTAAGAAILGVSKDSVASHDKFVAKHDLKVTLGSDEDNDFCETMGVWVEKSMYGKKFMGIERATYLVSATGEITEIWRKVKVPGHVEAVLEAVKKG